MRDQGRYRHLFSSALRLSFPPPPSRAQHPAHDAAKAANVLFGSLGCRFYPAHILLSHSFLRASVSLVSAAWLFRGGLQPAFARPQQQAALGSGSRLTRHNGIGLVAITRRDDDNFAPRIVFRYGYCVAKSPPLSPASHIAGCRDVVTVTYPPCRLVCRLTKLFGFAIASHHRTLSSTTSTSPMPQRFSSA